MLFYYSKFKNKHVRDTLKSCIFSVILSFIIILFSGVLIDLNTCFTYIFVVTFLLGFIKFIIGIISWIRVAFKIIMSDYADISKKELDEEMSYDESTYYDKLKLYLTPNYIIMLDKRFVYFNYSDILWMYVYNKKFNLIGKNKTIKILTSNGKTIKFAKVNANNEKENIIYNEIWNKIIKKNPNIKLGYTNENIDIFNKKVKDIKNNRRLGIKNVRHFINVMKQFKDDDK